MRSRALAFLCLFAPPAAAQPKQLPPNLVAPTDALSPADERKAFTVPAGFDVQLVASEPDIQKPMQMAWDAKGRLWVTTSYHYPFPAPKGKSTDKLFLLSDFDPATGKARKVQTFVSDLNIPIGVLPLPDCKTVIVSSVGEIRKYTDADGDGKADKSEVLFTGFGFDDTHGNTNSFTLMPDGWVYACHGFRNESTVKGKDGHEVKMQSGHTFRFRPDGSRIEVYTRGQVNPFGMAVDPWFNLYTADCHSKPITQLIPGAYYESFGKPHDGLGFGPHVTRHDHGSTGLCGVVWYDADHFPKDFLGCMFVGNVVTNRINFDKIEWRGASPVAKELPDFLTCTDRWFRPVDIKLGPDGALYVADFYNKVIGHYEVDLKHPGRDKDRGRIWRVVWKGKDGKAPAAKFAYSDLAQEPVERVNSLTGHDNLTVRLLATLQIQRRGKELVDWVEKNPDKSMAAFAFQNREYGDAHGLWASDDDATPGPDWLAGMLQGFLDKNLHGPYTPAHALRSAANLKDWQSPVRNGGSPLRQQVGRALQHKEPQIQRAAAEAVIFRPHADFVAPLVELLKKLPADDTHTRYAARIALRNCLRDDEKAWPQKYDTSFADVARAIPTKKAAAYLLMGVLAREGSDPSLPAVAEHIARYGTAGDEESLFNSLSRAGRDGYDTAPMLAAFKGVQARGARLGVAATKHVLEFAEQNARSGDFPVDGPNPANVKMVLWGLRVLNALPTVAHRSTDPKEFSLSGTSVQILGLVVANVRAPDEVRMGAAEVLLRYVPDEGLKVARKLIGAIETPADVRERFLLVFAASGNKEARLDARDSLKDAPYRTAIAVGAALASTPGGAEDLLTAVKMGKAPARLLQEKAILERLRAANIPGLDKQIAALTKGLPALDARLADLIKKRSASFASAKPDKEAGAKLFVKHCGACHRIADQGGKIAPQLDGIGIRGLERILEDTLDPNRNVDQAFRARVITTKDEKTITGLMLRVEGEVLVVADGEGKEIRIPTKEIATNRETMLSPMPANVGDIIPEADFAHLVAYLLDQKAKEPPKKE